VPQSAAYWWLHTIGAGLKTTFAATGAALGGAVAHVPTATQLLLTAGWPTLAGAIGAVGVRIAARPQAVDTRQSGQLLSGNE
jgi:hypothetical protein